MVTSVDTIITIPGNGPVVLITGASKRIGATLCKTLHHSGYRIAIHYSTSRQAANLLCKKLNLLRPNSAHCFQADLCKTDEINKLALEVIAYWGRVDALVNNASTFYPTPFTEANEIQWDELMGSNLKGPFFLALALAPALKKNQGRIVNIADINGRTPLKNYPIYSIAKAGNIMLTKTLAVELAPDIQVNGIAPGSILWPTGEASLDNSAQQSLLRTIPLNTLGKPEHIADLALLLIDNPGYLTGQVIAVDGGRNLISVNFDP